MQAGGGRVESEVYGDAVSLGISFGRRRVIVGKQPVRQYSLHPLVRHRAVSHQAPAGKVVEYAP
jgi:hypothetical protein